MNRVIPIENDEKLLEIKEELKKKGTMPLLLWIFGVNTSLTDLPYRGIRKSFKTALEQAGIQNFRFHDLRHTVGTRLVAGGSDLQTVKEYLAHSDLKTTQRYLHPVNENMQKAVNILDSF